MNILRFLSLAGLTMLIAGLVTFGVRYWLNRSRPDPPQSKTIYRLVTFAAYSISILIFHFAELLAQKTYNNLCSKEGILFSTPSRIGDLIVVLIILAVPVFLARSNALTFANATIAAMTLLGACCLLITAGNTPYECFTMGGNYEDHTSGLVEFEFWVLFGLLCSYVLLVIDLMIWFVKKVILFRAKRQIS